MDPVALLLALPSMRQLSLALLPPTAGSLSLGTGVARFTFCEFVNHVSVKAVGVGEVAITSRHMPSGADARRFAMCNLARFRAAVAEIFRGFGPAAGVTGAAGVNFPPNAGTLQDR